MCKMHKNRNSKYKISTKSKIRTSKKRADFVIILPFREVLRPLF